MSIELKIKAKSLAAETRIIRLEERKLKQRGTGRAAILRIRIAKHRLHVVRPEARATLLAIGYLRGRPYRAIERVCHEQPDWPKVESMVKRYGPPQHNTSFEEWKNGHDRRSPEDHTADLGRADPAG